MHLSVYGYLSLLCARFALGVSCSDATITSQSDADDLAHCNIISGDVNLSEVSGLITLNGVTQISGSLNSSLAVNLKSFSAPALESINGSLNIVASVIITSLTFPALTSIGSLSFNAVPYLLDISLRKEGLTSVANVSIIDTGLVQIDWLNMDTVENFVLKNNPGLKTLNLTALQNFTGGFDISGNDVDLAVTLPNVTSGNSIIVSDLASVGMGSLQHLAGNLELSGNNMSTISLPELVSASSVNISDNVNLKSVDLSGLVTINGELGITSNEKLANITLPSLEAVSGNVTLTGDDVSSISLPAVQYIGGTLSVNISSPNLDCDAIKTSNYATSSQDFVCSIVNQTSSNNGTSSSVSTSSTKTSAAASSTSSDVRKHTLSSAAKAGIGAGVGVGVPLIAGVVLFFVIVRRRRLRRRQQNPAGLSPNYGGGQGDTGVANRVEAPGIKSEMTSELEAGAKDRELVELGTTVVVDKSPIERQELAA